MALPSAPTRYGVNRAELAAALDGEPRYRLDQVWSGLYEQLADPARDHQPAQGAARPTGRRPPAGARGGHRIGERQRRHREVPVGTRRWQPGRDGADALSRPGDRVRQQPGRLRDGLRVLRHGSGRLPPPSHRRRDRGAGGPMRRVGPRRRAPREQHRVHGDGRADGQPRCRLAVRRTVPRRSRTVGPAHHHLDRRADPRHPEARRPPAPGQSGGVAPRRERHAARRARADQQALPHRRPRRGLRPTIWR